MSKRSQYGNGDVDGGGANEAQDAKLRASQMAADPPRKMASLGNARFTKAVAFALALLAPRLAVANEPVNTLHFSGMCEASAAAEIAPGLIAVANDEDNILRIYSVKGGAPILADDKVLSFLGVPTNSSSDIEGAARIGKRIYWITSHSLTKKGKQKPERSLLFTTEVTEGRSGPGFLQSLSAYGGLRKSLASSASLNLWNLADAAERVPESGKKPPLEGSTPPPATREEAKLESEGGLNIEGLAARRDGGLLVGLRSPVRDGLALLFTISNPEAVLKGAEATLTEPMPVDLGGLGVRAIARIGPSDDYLISAGPVGGDGPISLYRWHLGERAGHLLKAPGVPLGVEAVVVSADNQTEALLLSDDGDYPTENACGSPPQRFRGLLHSLVVGEK